MLYNMEMTGLLSVTSLLFRILKINWFVKNTYITQTRRPLPYVICLLPLIVQYDQWFPIGSYIDHCVICYQISAYGDL